MLPVGCREKCNPPPRLQVSALPEQGGRGGGVGTALLPSHHSSYSHQKNQSFFITTHLRPPASPPAQPFLRIRIRAYSLILAIHMHILTRS